MKKGDETKVITEEEYYAAFEKYSNATIVNFSYGASDAGKAEVVTNNELETRQGNIAEDVNVPEIVQETATEFAVKKWKPDNIKIGKLVFLELYTLMRI